MSLTGEAGAQHYSDEELRAIVDEAHRPACGWRRTPTAPRRSSTPWIVRHRLHRARFLMDDEAIQMMVDNGRFLVPTRRLAEAMDVSTRHRRSCRTRPPRCSRRRATSIKAAYEAGVKIAVGTDAPAIPHGRNADELVTLVDWGMPADAVLRAATVVAADLINRHRSRPNRRGLARGHHRRARRSTRRTSALQRTSVL